MANNFERMLQLVGEFFDTKNDPDQLDVTEADRERLLAIHPATMSEYVEGDGPVVWLMGIPTTTAIMEQFLRGEISETQLLYQTPSGIKYEALYLCSASVLPEFRGKGLAKKIALEAINKIRHDHPIKALFTWSFSDAGKGLGDALARECNLPIYERKPKPHLPEKE